MRDNLISALRLILFLTACGLTFVNGLPGLESFAQTGTVKVAPTSYLELVVQKIKQPGVTAEDAAEYANNLLAKNGFDYEFDACPVVKANRHPQSIQERYGLTKIYNYSLVRTDGRKIKLQLIGDPTEALCGECSFEIPLLRLKELTVGGESYTLRAGDRDFLPANTAHSAFVPGCEPVRYLIGTRYG